jgi:hypothetical protein
MHLLHSNADVANRFHQLEGEREAFEMLLPALVEVHGAANAWVWKRQQESFRLLCQTDRSGETGGYCLDLDDHELQQRLARVASDPLPMSFEVANADTSNTHVLTFASMEKRGEQFIVGLAFPFHQVTPDRIGAILDLLTKIGDPNGVPSNTANTVGLNKHEPHGPIGGDTSEEATTPSRQVSLSDYVHGLHQSLDPIHTACNVATETRRFIDCDRVSVLLAQRSHFRMAAISGQADVNRRSNVVVALENLAEVVLRTRSPFHYPGDGKPLAPQIETALEQYLSVCGPKEIVILPVFERTTSSSDEERPTNSSRVIAGLVLESIRDVALCVGDRQTLAFVKLHVADAIRNAAEHRNIFMYPIWKSVGKLVARITQRNRLHTLFALSCISLLVLVSFLAKGDVTVRAPGQLVPKVRSSVFAEVDGKVSEVLVSHGKPVSAGETLLTMQSEEMDARLAEVSGRLKTQRERIKVLELSGLRTPRGDNARSNPLTNNLSSLRAETESLEAQERTLIRMREKLVVQSPINGQVLTWDPQQRLDDRPVKVGELLLEVADSEGPWQIELQIPERRAGKLLRASDDPSPLTVTFVLASDPGKRYAGTLREIASTTQMSTDRSSVIRALVEFEGDTPPIDFRQVRSSVIAKINCGRTSLVSALLGDLIDFVESEILFRIW